MDQRNQRLKLNIEETNCPGHNNVERKNFDHQNTHVKNVTLMRIRPSTASTDLISRNQIRKKFSTSLKCGAHLIRYVFKKFLWLNLTLKIQN